jgi:hypothetical protein
MYNIRDSPLSEIEFQKYYFKKRNRADIVNDDIMCFDIETSSGFLHKDSDTLEPYLGKSKKYYEDCKKFAICYVWQFSINDNVFWGRTLEDFKDFLQELEYYEPHKKIVYIHNFSFEFQFLINVLQFDYVFSRQARKPLFAEWSTYQFRCSYFLTNMSLATWAEQKKLSVQKLVGDLVYTILRTPKTKLTDTELAYCFNDVLVMYFGLLQYKEKYGHIIDIPFTQTGEVRKEVIDRMNVSSEYKYRKRCIKLIPESIEDYTLLCDCLMGGYAHSNAVHTNVVLDNVRSKDISSSYPIVMCLEKYPMTYFEETVPCDDYFNNDDYSYIITFDVEHLHSKRWNTWLSFSKCSKIKGYSLDNGRVLKADYVQLSLTNIDYEMFKLCYDFDNLNIIDFRISSNDYLSPTFVKYILELYGNKTTLKGIKEKEPLYMKSKQYINSMYGMMVTKNITDTIEFEEDRWKKYLLNEKNFYTKIASEKKKLSKTFGAFQFGVWVTAYARRNLWKGILALDYNVAYCDTDSIKYIDCDTDFFERYNKEIERRENMRADMLGVKRDKFCPRDKNGIPHRLGIFDDDGQYKKFKTLGAKKYCYVDNDDKLHMTVSGVRKSAVSQLHDIEDFKDGTVFDVEHSQKLIMTYVDDMPPIVWNKGKYDEFHSNYKHGICAQPTTYSLGITDDYESILTMVQNKREVTSIFERETEIL